MGLWNGSAWDDHDGTYVRRLIAKNKMKKGQCLRRRRGIQYARKKECQQRLVSYKPFSALVGGDASVTMQGVTHILSLEVPHVATTYLPTLDVIIVNLKCSRRSVDYIINTYDFLHRSVLASMSLLTRDWSICISPQSIRDSMASKHASCNEMLSLG